MDKQREMFEAWYNEHCEPGVAPWFVRDGDNSDEYYMSHTQTAWDAWQAAIAAQKVNQVAELPKYDCFSSDYGDSWEGHPASDCFVHGRKIGDEFELLAGWTAQRVTFRVTKVPDEKDDDYEVEQVDPQPPAQPQAECGSCDGFDSGCEECSGLGKDGHLAALRQLANVAHRVAHAMWLPAGFDVTTLPDVVAQRLAAQKQAEPRCACGDSFTSDAVCANCLAAEWEPTK